MWTLLASVLGGLGLFMLAVGLITDGLRLAAGDALRGLLARSTRTRLRGIATGVGITAVVQSSSAVTVATIGFVNAGLLSLGQALGIVYGANLGTTMTGWLVSAVGFGFSLEAFALPLVGLGMLLRLTGAGSRRGALGEALAGFGLFFLGVDVLRDAFTGLSARLDPAALAPQGILGVLAYVGVGFVATLLTQSSSAAIALVLTAASGGALALDAAAATVIGANLGTTSTAALATIGATANARRVAAAHIAFNALTGGVALLILPGMLWATQRTGSALGLPPAPAPTLALFHTLFNLAGVLLMLPLSARLTAFLSRRFVTPAEALARPRFLDANVLVTPALAIEAMRRELLRATALAREACLASLHSRSASPDGARLAALQELTSTVGGFIGRLERRRLGADEAERLATVLRVNSYLADVVWLEREFRDARPALETIFRGPALPALSTWEREVVAHIEACDPEAPGFDPQALGSGFDALQREWHALKSALLLLASRGELPVDHLNGALEALRSQLKLGEQLGKAARRLHGLAPATDRAP